MCKAAPVFAPSVLYGRSADGEPAPALRCSRRRSARLPSLAMGYQYVAEARLRSMMIELVRMDAPSCLDLEIDVTPSPYRPQNWRIGRLDVAGRGLRRGARQGRRATGDAPLDLRSRRSRVERPALRARASEGAIVSSVCSSAALRSWPRARLQPSAACAVLVGSDDGSVLLRLRQRADAATLHLTL